MKYLYQSTTTHEPCAYSKAVFYIDTSLKLITSPVEGTPYKHGENLGKKTSFEWPKPLTSMVYRVASFQIGPKHYSGVIMSATASQVIGVVIVY